MSLLDIYLEAINKLKSYIDCGGNDMDFINNLQWEIICIEKQMEKESNNEK